MKRNILDLFVNTNSKKLRLRVLLRPIGVALTFFLTVAVPAVLFAQSAPSPNYSGPQTYVINVPITALSPSNSGGAVAAPGYSSSKSTLFSGTSYVVFDRDASGNLYAFDYSNTSNKKLVKLSSTGSVLATYLTFLSRPEDIEVDAAGNIFALDGSTLYKITSGGTVSTLSSSLSNANGIGLDGADNVYVAEYSTSLTSVIEVPADGSSTINIGSGLSFMTDVAVDNAGNIYVCNDGDASIKEIPAGGGSMITIASGFTSFNTSDLTNIIVDSIGDIFFTERNGAKVSEIPAGTTTPVQISSGFFAPAGLALDLAGNLYIGDNGSVYKVAQTGGYFISPALPAGLSISPTTGVISGTPTVLSPATAYNITASNSTGSHTTQLTITVSNTAPSSDAKLSNLTIQHGALSPPFDPATFSYTVNLPNSITGVTLVPTTDDAGATMVTYGGAIASGATSASVPLAAGSNIDHIIVTAADGVAKDVYSINFIRADTVLTTVNSIVALSATLTNASRVNYTATFGAAITGLTAGNFSITASGVTGAVVGTPTTSDGGVTWTVPVNTGTGDGTIQLSLSNATGLTPGISTTLPFAGDTYTIDKTPPTATISAPSAALIGTGASGTVTYTVTYADANFNTSSLATGGITLNTTGTAAGIVGVTGSGTSYTVTISNITGLGAIGISVTAGNASDLAGNTDAGAGPSATFNVLSTDATLASLSLSSGTLSPTFSPGGSSYAATVTYSTGTIAVTATPNDAGATVATTVNGTPASGSAPLNVGPNTIITTVTAADGTTTDIYTTTVTRLPSENALLAGINPSVSPLSPLFTPGTTSYTLNVSNATTTMTVKPVTIDPNATIKVNGSTVISGTTSTPITLAAGTQTTITIQVTAANGHKKTYTVTITRADAANANLSAIQVGNGTLKPAFTPAITSYNDGVTNLTTSTTITPTAADPKATITVNGTPVTSGTPYNLSNLALGDNTATIVVTAADGISKKTYTVSVTRVLSINCFLASLSPSKPLTPVFAPSTTDYTLEVSNTTATMTIIPVTAEPHATLTINTAPATSGTTYGPIALAQGPNTITVVVTAQDGTSKKTYTITVTRDAPGGANTVYQPIGVEKPITTPTLAEDDIAVHQGISPNGDGQNDFLQIDNISQYPENKLSIMNRNGQLVYEAKGYDNTTKAFDGHSNKNGQMQLPGTYFYQLEYTINGIIKHKTGFIVLKY